MRRDGDDRRPSWQPRRLCNVGEQPAEHRPRVHELWEDPRRQLQAVDERERPLAAPSVEELRRAGIRPLPSALAREPVGEQVGNQEHRLRALHVLLGCEQLESASIGSNWIPVAA